jgi:hypothetical protein
MERRIPIRNPAVDASMNELFEANARRLKREQDTQEAVKGLHVLGTANLASEFHDRIAAQIEAFDKELDQEHEVGMRLVSFGQSITFHVEEIGFHNPSLLMFRGRTEAGDPVCLIQHVTQISFLLLALKRPDPSQPKKPFGFAAGRSEAEENM